MDCNTYGAQNTTGWSCLSNIMRFRVFLTFPQPPVDSASYPLPSRCQSSSSAALWIGYFHIFSNSGHLCPKRDFPIQAHVHRWQHSRRSSPLSTSRPLQPLARQTQQQAAGSRQTGKLAALKCPLSPLYASTHPWKPRKLSRAPPAARRRAHVHTTTESVGLHDDRVIATPLGIFGPTDLLWTVGARAQHSTQQVLATERVCLQKPASDLNKVCCT